MHQYLATSWSTLNQGNQNFNFPIWEFCAGWLASEEWLVRQVVFSYEALDSVE